MIPLKLQIKNFLSYGAEIQTIDFSHYPLICFSGKNGHGKSALLDAITWAIWGQARKIGNTSKADQGLLHLGQSSMMVIIDFSCNNICYRIRREYSHNFGKPYAVLEFGLIQQETETLIPLTDKTIRATQDKIEKTLHLDFDTFINSAFLRQGQSNEFSKKSPKERKDIIASILGLNHYESIRKLATEKIKSASTEKATLLTFQQKYEQELNSLGMICIDIAQINEKIAAIDQKEKDIALEHSTGEKQYLQLMQDQNSYELLRLKQQQLGKDENELITHIRTIKDQWRSIRRQQKNSSDYQSLEKQKNKLTLQLQEQQNTIQKLLVIKEEYLLNKAKLAAIEQTLRIEHAHKVQQKQLLINTMKYEQQTATQSLMRAQEAEIAIARETKQLADKHKALASELGTTAMALKHKETVEKQFERRKEYYHRFIAQGNGSKNELTALEKKQLLVHDDNDPSCPLCEQNLSASRKKFLKNKFSEQKNFLTYRIGRLSRLISTLKELLLHDHTWLETHKQTENRHAALQATIHEIEKQQLNLTKKTNDNKEEITTLVNQNKKMSFAIANEENGLKEITTFNENSMRTNSEYATIYQQFHEQELQTKDFVLQMQEQQTIHNAIQTIEIQLSECKHLEEQLHLQRQRLLEISKTCGAVKEMRKEKMGLLQEEQRYAHLENSIKILQQKMSLYNASTQQLRQEKNQCLEQKGNLEAQKTKLLSLESEYKNQQKMVHELSQTIDDYTIIAQTAGKDGIQALLIEDAIPEIEQEANSLLAKLTDNQAHLSIESLRDLKKGGTKETLDIKISDAIGIRPYELFSGGEAFRIDFALRIAISKLLARRAGTALQTLIDR